MDAIQTLIANLQQTRVSSQNEPLIAVVANFIAALNEIEGAIGPGAVSSVTNSDTYLSIAPTTGAVVANVDLATLGPAITPDLLKTSNTQFGIAQVDGTTIISTGGLISAVTSGLPPGDIVLPNTNILVGNALNVAAAVAMSGEASITNTGAVTLQAASSSLPGIVPASGGGTTNFLRADLTWAAVPAGASGANPTATAGPAAVNGVATTFMRSDGAPAIQLASAANAGLAQVDNTSITASGGVISAVAANSGGTVAGTVTIDAVSIHINGNGKIATGFIHPGFAANRYYWGVALQPSGTTTGVSSGTIYASLFYCPYPTTFSKISVYASGTGGNVELGIYNVGGGIPTTLFQDCGSIAIVNGSTEITGLTINLPAGSFALVALFSATPSIAYGSVNQGDNSMFGSSNAEASTLGASWHGTQAFGALPGTFPSPSVAESATCPLVFLRL